MWVKKWPKFFKLLSTPRQTDLPGPTMTSPFEFSRRMSSDPLGYLTDIRDTYGDIVRLPAPVIPTYQVTDPDFIGKLLLGTEKNNTKSLGYRRIKPLLGEGLLTSTGPLWKTQRKLANPAFHQKVLETFVSMIHQETLRVAEDWERRIKKDPIINVSEEMTRLTFTVIVKALFSMDLSEKAHMVKTNLKIVQDYANYLFYAIAPIPMEFPLPKNIRARRALNKMNQLVFELIEEHKQHPDQYQDLLSAYLAAKDEDTGASMSEQLVRDEVMTLMLAGHDTTALSMSIAFEQIAKHPEIQAKLDEEFATLPGDSLTMADLKNLTYTNQVFSETMRLYPAAWAVGRELTQDLKYKDYEFTKGSTFIISQYLTHRHPKYWDRPDEFNPDRFSPEASKERHPFVYFPFGGGQRTCIGSNLAKLESQIIMPILLRRFRMESIQGYQYKIHPRISLVLDPGVRLKVTPR